MPREMNDSMLARLRAAKQSGSRFLSCRFAFQGPLKDRGGSRFDSSRLTDHARGAVMPPPDWSLAEEAHVHASLAAAKGGLGPWWPR